LAYQGIANVKFVAVADEDSEGLKNAAKRTGADALYQDYREMLDKEQLDIVSVCPRWADCHKDMVIACAEAKTHIHCEKPLARTLEEADKMLEACDKNNVKMSIAHVWRRRPDIVAALDLVKKGKIGKLISLQGRGKEDRRGGGEDLIVLGTHVLDIMRFFAGDVLYASANVRADGHDITDKDIIIDAPEGLGAIAGDSLFACYVFADGVFGAFQTHRNQKDQAHRFGVNLYGSEAIIAVRSSGVYLYPYPIILYDNNDVQWQKIGSQEGWNAQQAIVEDLITAIEEERESVSSGADGRAALEMIMAVYESQRLGKKIEFPMNNRKHPLMLYNSEKG